MHVHAIQGSAQESAFRRHIEKYHEGDRENVDFKVSIIRTYEKPLERQVREGVDTIGADCDILMNSKLDHNRPGIANVAMNNDIDVLE